LSDVDGQNEIKIAVHNASYEEMLKAGYVHKVLWLTQDIERYLLGKQELKWNWR
jgi:hypothetical protein